MIASPMAVKSKRVSKRMARSNKRNNKSDKQKLGYPGDKNESMKTYYTTNKTNGFSAYMKA